MSDNIVTSFTPDYTPASHGHSVEQLSRPSLSY